jgi:glycosyltransferase involved in cell wall biosynthesis
MIGPVDEDFDLTVAVTYYDPYVSGLTHTARCLAEGLAARGWRVAVVAAQHDPDLPRHEQLGGVQVFRSPVLVRASRAFVAPGYPLLAGRLARRSGLLHLHLPMAEAGIVPRLAGRTPIVSTLHIDLHLPPSPLRGAIVAASDLATRAALRRSAAVVANSDEQARASKHWPLIRQRALTAIPAPCVDRRGGRPRYRETGGLHVGFLGRIVQDKGIEYLIRAFRRIPDPQARLLIAGNHATVAGGSNLPLLRAEIGTDHRIRLLGELRGGQIDDLYASIDVFALPSVAESFGIVQVEAMMTGVPSVTTDLPGGRYPVTSTGFGRVVPPRDPPALERALLDLARASPQWRHEQARLVRERFSVIASLDAYERLFRSVRDRAGAPAAR